MIPVAPYTPDRAPLDTGITTIVSNVIAEEEASYSPCPSLEAVTSALTARCQGAASFRHNDTIVNFAFDATKAYKQNEATWDDVTRSLDPYAVATDDFVTVAQYGAFIIACNGTDEPQHYEIGTSTLFSDLAGTPPVGAHFVVVVGDHVVMGNYASAKNGIRYSAVNDPESWPVGNVQVFPDGGNIAGLAGGRDLTVFLDNLIKKGTLTGDADVFQFDTISSERGCAAPGSIAQYQERIFFLSYDGFFMLTPAGFTPIGEQQVDNTFWFGNNDTPGVNIEYLHRVKAICDPIHKLYRVIYPSTNSSSGLPDKMLIYNWSINRWTTANYNAEYLFRARTGLGKTLEELDALYPSGLDSIPVSLDSFLFATTAQETLAAFDSAHKMAFFQGANMAATVDSAEAQIFTGKKAKIQAVRPHIDGGTASVRIGVRDNKLNDTVRFTDAVAMRDTGRCPFAVKRTKGRLHKARVEIAAGQVWRNFQGVDFDAVEAGTR